MDNRQQYVRYRDRTQGRITEPDKVFHNEQEYVNSDDNCNGQYITFIDTMGYYSDERLQGVHLAEMVRQLGIQTDGVHAYKYHQNGI